MFVGNAERESAKRRKQDDYRRELQLQIEEEAARRKRWVILNSTEILLMLFTCN